ncbi:unnamed protein product [Polarella glacialis]|uniref:Acyltransferase n=1 Tax=Polarella glacialis TaxID=89957 RepID=A0A813DI25_POLGL|nr:unnamed protein product [Polarella glacialis]
MGSVKAAGNGVNSVSYSEVSAGPANNNISQKSLDAAAGRPASSWWLSAALMFFSGIAWVVSIPLLMVALGGSLQPHLGWMCGICTALALFSVLVQVEQWIAACGVFLVSFGSASQALAWQPMLFAGLATWMALLNVRRQVCRPSPWLLELQYQKYAGYHMRSELHGALETVREGKSFFACHPHGILSVGWISNVVWGRQFHKSVGRCFYLIDPTLRNKGLLAKFFLDAFEGPHGGLRDTSSETIQSLMQQGESLCMVPGAYQEATRFSYGKERVALLQRMGFVKYCLRHGYRLHPVYTFGEAETYLTLNGFDEFRLWLNSKGIPTVAFWGLPWCPLLPRRDLELLTFVGPPLELPKVAQPSPEQVEEWHGKYVQALQELFDKHKAQAGKPDAVLEIF